MNAKCENEIRELSIAELEAVSGGKMVGVNLGPIRINWGDGMISVGVKGLGSVNVGVQNGQVDGVTLQTSGGQVF